jgi:tetratricopeptide (TPR) repeat protein
MLGSDRDPLGPSPKGILNESDKSKFSLGMRLLKTDAYAQAYRTFKELSASSQSASVLFNLALCQAKAGAYQDAADSLERALPLVVGTQRDLPNDVIFEKLRSEEKKNSSYRTAFPQELPSALPLYAKECIRRFLVDIYAELGLWDKVRSTAAAVSGTGYSNIASALALADGK